MKKMILLVILVLGVVSISGSGRPSRKVEKDINQSLDSLKNSFDRLKIALDEN